MKDASRFYSIRRELIRRRIIHPDMSQIQLHNQVTMVRDAGLVMLIEAQDSEDKECAMACIETCDDFLRGLAEIN